MMNQDNINFDPMMGQPVSNQSSNNKKFNIKIITIVVVAVIISGGIILAITRENKLNNKVDNNSNQTIQDNDINNQNQTLENDNVNSNSNSSSNNNNNNNNSESFDSTTIIPADSNAFFMSIEDVFTKNGKTLVLGNIARGKVTVGDKIQIVGLNAEPSDTIVDGLTSFGKNYTEANIGERINIVLHDINYNDVKKGQVVAKPDSIKAVKSFEADVYVYTAEEGGRHTPFYSNYRPQFQFSNIDVIGTINLPDGIEKANPGEKIRLNIKLDDYIAMEVGTKFEIHDGDINIVGNGVVTKIN